MYGIISTLNIWEDGAVWEKMIENWGIDFSTFNLVDFYNYFKLIGIIRLFREKLW